MTDLQLSVLLEQIGNRLDSELRALCAEVPHATTVEHAQAIMAGAWEIRCDLDDQAMRLRGLFGGQRPEL